MKLIPSALRAVILLCGALYIHTGHAQDTASAAPDTAASYVGSEVCMACHPAHLEQMHTTRHGQAADGRTPFADKGCETCHGPGSGHVAGGGGRGVGGLTVFGENVRTPATEQNKVCLQCHQAGQRMQWQGSQHETGGLACSSCHTVHRQNAALDRQTQADVCFSCHRDIRAYSNRAYGHPLREHKVVCSDCHNPHGSTTSSLLKRDTTNEVCYGCHAEKRGPFLWEHPPAVEDCTLCHSPHGSMHPGDLVARPPQLCQRCHATSDIGLAHTRQPYSFNNSGPGSASARFALSGSCLNCHSQIHGSNHPSGVDFMR